MVTHFGGNSVYIVFISQSIHDVINYEFGLNWDIRIYIAFTLIPILCIGQVSIGNIFKRFN